MSRLPPAPFSMPTGEFYGAAHSRELFERVFPQSWAYFEVSGPATKRARPGTLLPGSLDEPILWLQDGSNSHLVSNVCSHRAHPVCLEPQDRETLRCPYHGRRFDGSGRCLSSPGFEGVEGFPSEAEDLPPIPWGEFLGIPFASLSPRHSFDAFLEPVRQRMGFLEDQDFVLDPKRSQDYEFDANWILYCENYLEGLHIPFVHPGLAKVVDFDAYRTELFPGGSLQIAEARTQDLAFELPPLHPERGEAIAAYYFFLHPNTMLNFYPWGLSLNLVLPQGPDRTRVLFRSFVRDPDRLEEGAGANLDTVEFEDEAVVQAVQRGVRSRLYRGGRLSPRFESTIPHFHEDLRSWSSPVRV